MSRMTVVAVACALCGALAPAATAQEAPEAPLLHPELERGALTVAASGDAPPAVPHAADGDPSDWVGTPSRFGGTTLSSAGELIYQDHLFDAYGPDDGDDASREAVLGPLREGVPHTYRVEPVLQQGFTDDLGAPTPSIVRAREEYGDLQHVDAADLHEVRVAVDDETVWVLARTTTMTDERTAVLLIADTSAGSTTRTVPFASGLRTAKGDVAALVAAGSGRVVRLSDGATIGDATVGVGAGGWTNAIEAAIPRDLVARPDGSVSIALAAGRANASGDGLAALAPRDGATVPDVRIANVAFRHAEPVRTWFDRDQALALGAGTIDAFFIDVPLDELAARVMERPVPRRGYHDRIFVSSEAISQERGQDGIVQHYGLYVPGGSDGEAKRPMTMWLHWRGGKAHSAATVSPRIFRDQGEARGGFVVAPRGRGTATWYLGRGHTDVLEVWDDAFDSFAIDADRVYASGHSMGGWGSYLLPILYPDRFAGTFPVDAPVTQGAWTGLDFDGCDDLNYDEYSFCYVQTNGGDARTQHTRSLLDNLRWVPTVIFQGAISELVPVTGPTRQVERLIQLGYRHRYYVFPAYEHYSHPVWDEWTEGVRYLDGFRRDPNPPRVTYVRDMPFERRVEEGPDRSEPEGLSFDFDRAYWMSGLEASDPVGGRAHVDARTLAIRDHPVLTVPEAGGPSAPGQAGPFVMSGIAWLDDPRGRAPAARNAFEATLSGASAVRFDLDRMAIESDRTVTGTVVTERPLRLSLAGSWTDPPTVTVGGEAAAGALDGSVLTVTLPAGRSVISVSP